MSLNSLDLMGKRLGYRGGIPQQDRMIEDKRKSLEHAFLYSYQGAKIQKVDAIEGEPDIPALMNPNKLTENADDKIVSVRFEDNIKIGDVFTWHVTKENELNTKWLVYSQEITELAYFKGDVRRCRYTIKWEDKNKKRYMTYAAVIGPKETNIHTALTSKPGQFSLDSPNNTLHILLPGNLENEKHFNRYTEFYLCDLDGQPLSTCWRVNMTDKISMPGIIELVAEEYYGNEHTDNKDEGIVDGLIPKPLIPISDIEGESYIKAKITYTYTYKGTEPAQWSFDPETPIIVSYDNENKSIKLKWTKTFSGEFILTCNGVNKTIHVKSLM